ncbi:pentatricopeptide repeat-containing protein At5g67570, chloroplastic isoform X1 [Actinidia eriantha]|uniref:pentatricopeptide repeat-containing protein At5g67570, chloroplastic isoform X1 n=1 Tax=Actinidia eriantha TaxID=165200 RepID=UPI00258E6A85|nr:pentatricopeptide repeat-containing protein At5g67570, chloroplastic isoform X1 [Actinidia eriantha]
MEASTLPPRLPPPPPDPTTDKIKQNLLNKGVYPTPKIIHNLRKKHLQKSLRKSNRRRASHPPPLTASQKQVLDDEAHFQALKFEYKNFTHAIDAKASMVGKPWERLERHKLRDLASSSKEYGGEKLRSEHLRELSEFLERDCDKFRWLLEDDIEMEEGWLERENRNWAPRKRDEVEAIQFLVDKLSGADLSLKDWKFSRMMKKSELQFTEGQLLRIVEGLGERGQWRQALSVVEWVYSSKEHRHYKSRFVYTKLLAVLGKGRRPREALQIFDLMREDCQIYPDMAAYHSVAVTLGQAGFLKELLNVVECMREKPVKRMKNMRRKNWDPCLQPDVVVFNAVLNALVPSHQWKGVSWVFEQLRKNGLRPNGATYGLAMEVMLRSGKFDLVHEFFRKMRRSGEAPKALTYKVLVRAFWEEGKVDEAVQAVRDMERRGVLGTACVYYELACCLCNNGRWQEALLEVEKLKKLPRTKPLEVTFTGMIMSSMNGGHVHGCISIFQHIKDRYAIDIGIINAMLKVYGMNDMFSKAKELFEETKRVKSDSNQSLDGFGSSLTPDAYTYSTMLEASAGALQWEYFEYVYREMALSGYPLDQRKHAFLLVKASRAGKSYLLEHAFDTMLEAGDIPDPSVFTELLCQAIIQRDYERVATIVNTMAHAPFQVSEKQWTDLFESNGDRISRESLDELLETLGNSQLPTEATVSNFSRSLLCFCRSNNGGDIPTSVAFGDSSVDLSASAGNNVQLRRDESANDNTHDIHVGSGNGRVDDADSEMFRFTNYDSDGDDDSLFKSFEDLALGVTSNESADDCDNEFSNHTEYGNLDIEDVELDVLNGIVGDSHESNLPSADEILESWKQSRERDGIFLPFQSGGK